MALKLDEKPKNRRGLGQCMTSKLAEKLVTEGGVGGRAAEKHSGSTTVSGHDFSRAEIVAKSTWALAPECSFRHHILKLFLQRILLAPSSHHERGVDAANGNNLKPQPQIDA